jgi:transposase InsO family protein
VKFQFIAAQQNEFPVRRLCRVLGVSPSGYYAWRTRPSSRRRSQDAVLLVEIRRIHQHSRQTYGSPRIHAELRAHGQRCNHKRIERLMRQQGIRARGRGRFRRTTEVLSSLPVVPNRLNQEFNTNAANQVWTADITYLDTAEGWLFLATVVDLYSRRVVGWAMAEHMEARLVCDALQMAFTQRQPKGGLLHHSDRGRQYASAEYQALLAAHGIECSMSRRGNCYDNAVHESFFGTLKSECAEGRFASRTAARQSVFEYIEVWYNRQRRHSTLGYLSPAEFEQVRTVS